MSTIPEPRAALARFWKLPKLPKQDLRFREWVYFLRADCHVGLVKIGRARDLKWRVLQLQSQCPVTLKLIAAVDAPAGTEHILHLQFAGVRQHGEWFLPAPELLELVTSLPKGGKLQHAQVIAFAPAVDCQKHFDFALERKGPSGRAERDIEPTDADALRRARQHRQVTADVFRESLENGRLERAITKHRGFSRYVK